MRESLTALGGTIGALRARPTRPLALIAQIYLHAAQRDMDATSGTVVVVALQRCRR